MIVDACTYLGPHARRLIGREPKDLARELSAWDVGVAYASRLEALWLENPHDANRLPMAHKAESGTEIRPAPVLDASLGSWMDELDRLQKAFPDLDLIRIHPTYHGYTLDQAGPLLDALGKRKIVAQVIARVEDVRRHHRLAQVPDLPLAQAVEAARKHTGATILLSGANALPAPNKGATIPANLWADCSQIDGELVVAELLQGPWGERLVFGSNAPLFSLNSAFARVLVNLDDARALRILEGNPAKLFPGVRRAAEASKSDR